MPEKTLKGRLIFSGTAAGQVLKSEAPLGLFGHLEPKTGVYREAGHPLDGKCVKGRVLVFPRAKGSTVGSYILYALRKTGKAPAAMILSECDTIVAVGAIIGSIPTVDSVDISALEDGAAVRVKDREVILEAR
jgi:predicted aconitase with swiveling domain